MELGYLSLRDGERTSIQTLTITIVERKDGKVTAESEGEMGTGQSADEALSDLFYRLSQRS